MPDALLLEGARDITSGVFGVGANHLEPSQAEGTLVASGRHKLDAD